MERLCLWISFEFHPSTSCIHFSRTRCWDNCSNAVKDGVLRLVHGAETSHVSDDFTSHRLATKKQQREVVFSTLYSPDLWSRHKPSSTLQLVPAQTLYNAQNQFVTSSVHSVPPCLGLEGLRVPKMWWNNNKKERLVEKGKTVWNHWQASYKINVPANILSDHTLYLIKRLSV